ncbi:hypothetical protein [Ralstonia solanacearum]|uniref:hypothetical protein n=1 Tax=Ralstonia solanacearum TaxID=305 RepID=UPI000B2B5863|nr:hypothetical protein [Ralstonia solanacearum]
MGIDTTIATVTAIAGLVAGWAGWVGIVRKRFVAVCDGLAVVEPRQGIAAPIEVRFCGDVVPKVTRTLVYLWNDGNRELHRNDILQADPIRIRVGEDAKLLAANIIQSSQDGLGTKTLPYSDRERLFLFDRLPPGQGAIVEVYHTSSDPMLEVTGSINGVSRIRNKASKGAYFDELRKRRSTARLVGATVCAFLTMAGGAVFFAASGPRIDFVSLLRIAPMVLGEIVFIILLPNTISRFRIPADLRSSPAHKK